MGENDEILWIFSEIKIVGIIAEMFKLRLRQDRFKNGSVKDQKIPPSDEKMGLAYLKKLLSK